MNDTPTVTVLIATWNKADVLHYTIRSVLWQTFEDFELWVLGDGCTDHTEEVVLSFNDPRVHWFNFPENTGDQSAPHNEGLRRAKGKYIAYLNHDDIWLPHHLETLVNTIEETNTDFVYSIMEMFPKVNPHPHIPDYPNAPVPPEATQTLHRKDVIDDIGYWRRPWETYSWPRVDFFNRAQIAGKVFKLAPMLTALKMWVDKENYPGATQQQEFMELIEKDPHFAEREMGIMLARAEHELDNPITFKRMKRQLTLIFKRLMVRFGMDPSRNRFWLKQGKKTRDWRANFGLDTKVIDEKMSKSEE